MSVLPMESVHRVAPDLPAVTQVPNVANGMHGRAGPQEHHQSIPMTATNGSNREEPKEDSFQD